MSERCQEVRSNVRKTADGIPSHGVRNGESASRVVPTSLQTTDSNPPSVAHLRPPRMACDDGQKNSGRAVWLGATMFPIFERGGVEPRTWRRIVTGSTAVSAARRNSASAPTIFDTSNRTRPTLAKSVALPPEMTRTHPRTPTAWMISPASSNLVWARLRRE